MKRLTERAIQLAAEHSARVASRAATQIAERFAGVSAVAERGAVLLTGRGLKRRWLTEMRTSEYRK